jgi:citrate lyase subunit beta / citryl-CoA lyase
MMAKAAASAADVVVLDLEDSVPVAEKASARSNVVRALNDFDWGSSMRSVRINSVDTMWCHDDVIDVVSGAGSNLDTLVVPKIFGPRDVWFVDDLLTQVEAKLGLRIGGIGLDVLIEEAQALARVDEIAHCSPRLGSMILGVGDLAASLGMRVEHIGAASADYPGDMWHAARTRLIVAARSAGIDAIDGPLADFSDVDGFERSARSFAVLGGVGKWCIHPSQIESANRVFSPTADEIARARRIVQAVDDAERSGAGAATLDGHMIDAATARSAFAIIRWHPVSDTE